MKRFQKADAILLIAFLALLAFPLQYAFRHLDDNTLTSWRWVFEHGRMPGVFAFVALGTLFAYLFSRAKFPEKRPALFLFALSFLAVVPFWGAPESVLDAGRYMLQAKHLELYGVSSFFRQWGRELAAWTDLPVVPFFYGQIFRYGGETRLLVQVFTTLLFSLTVVLTYQLGKALWDRETGFLAGLFLLGMPYLLTQAPLMLVDVPFMFVLTLSLFLYLGAVEKGGHWRMAAASAAVVLAAFSKYSAGPMLIVLLCVSAVCFRKGRSVALLRSAAVLAGAALCSAVIFIAKHDVFLHQLHLLREYQAPGLARWQEGFVSTFLYQVHPVVTLSALFAVILAIKNRDARFFIPSWFVVFALVCQVGRIRYLLPLFPLLALMAACGLQAVREWELKKFIAGCAVASSFAIAFGAYLPFLNSTNMANLRDAGAYLDALPGETVEVRTLPQTRSQGNTETAIPILDLYTKKRLVYRQEAAKLPNSEQIEKSPLRFSWEVRPGSFYTADVADPGEPYVAVLSSRPFKNNGIAERGKNIVPLKTFLADTGTFRFRTFVAVFTREALAKTAQ